VTGEDVHGPYRSREHAQRQLSADRHARSPRYEDWTEGQQAEEAIMSALAAARVELTQYERDRIAKLCEEWPLLLIDPVDAQMIAGLIRRAHAGSEGEPPAADGNI
jgi:hypothetical protein